MIGLAKSMRLLSVPQPIHPGVCCRQHVNHHHDGRHRDDLQNRGRLHGGEVA